VDNVYHSLERDGTCMITFRVVVVLLLLVVLLPVLLLLVVGVLLLLPCWNYCPGCLLSLGGIARQSNHEPDFMRPGQAQESQTRTDEVALSVQQVPEELRGIFYMRNNPLSDDLVCMERGTWNEMDDTLLLPVYVPRAWSFKSQLDSLTVLLLVRVLRYRYQFRATKDERGRVTDMRVKLTIFCCSIPDFFMKWGMTDVSKEKDGSLWERWNFMFGIPFPSYWCEKVVDKDGQKTSYFHHVLQEVPEGCICIAGT